MYYGLAWRKNIAKTMLVLNENNAMLFPRALAIFPCNSWRASKPKSPLPPKKIMINKNLLTSFFSVKLSSKFQFCNEYF